MSIRISTEELDQLADDLANNVDRLKPEVDQVVERGALNVRRDARRLIREQSTGTYLPHYPRSITYDVDDPVDYAEAEIGPEEGKPQGGMGRGVEFGSARTAPLPHLHPALDLEIPRLVKHLRRVVGKALQ